MDILQNDKLKSILINEKIINKSTVLNSIPNLIEFLLTERLVSYNVLKNILIQHFSIKSTDLTEVNINKKACDVLKHETALKYTAFPFDIKTKTLYIAIADPLNTQAIEDISIATNMKVVAFFAEPSQVSLFIDRYYNFNDDHDIESEISSATETINSLIKSAILQKASDIHIEPNENHAKVRFRLDGALISHQLISVSIFPKLLSRLKTLANLDIAEYRFPKDGSFKLSEINNVDFRISTLPTIFGEKVVIRLIYKEISNFSFENNNLGFSATDIETIKTLLKSPNGAILVTGPTGSGKTTTLSCFISHLNKDEVNITTIEDPVENIIPGVNHVSINAKIGLHFINVLRHILRQDPDIIMIGEIRDTETASIVIRAAITGHLVLSTLHTNDALSTIVRLMDMGIEKYLLIEAIKGIISQRLVRRLCNYCKRTTNSPAWFTRKFAINNTLLYEKVGCKKCFGTGFNGRFAIYEIIIITPELKKYIANNSLEEIKILMENELVTIKKNAINSLLEGNTTLEEVYSLIMGE